jgi:hypothetical protein
MRPAGTNDGSPNFPPIEPSRNTPKSTACRSSSRSSACVGRSPSWLMEVKFARRQWAAITVVSLLILTLAGGLAATSYEAAVASTQRDAALQAQSRLLTEAADQHLKNTDVAGAQGIILEVLTDPRFAQGVIRQPPPPLPARQSPSVSRKLLEVCVSAGLATAMQRSADSS